MGKKTASFSRWLWSGKNKQETTLNKLPASVNLSTVSSPLTKGTSVDSNSKGGGGEMKIDREYDAVLVPSHQDPLSESGELDWSIGWLESFSPEFQSDDENDSSYAVLVPSYKPSCIERSNGMNVMTGNVVRGVSYDYSAGKFLWVYHIGIVGFVPVVNIISLVTEFCAMLYPNFVPIAVRCFNPIYL